MNRIMPRQRPRELELRTRQMDWTKARARDRRSWPSPAAWAQALLQLAGTALVRAQAQARLLGSDHREFFALMASVERIADDRFFVICDGKLIYVEGPRRSDDPRPGVIAKAARLADVAHSVLLAAADQQETAIRRLRRSHRRGLELAESYIARRPMASKAAKVSPRAASVPASRPSRSARLFESCGGGWFVFVGVEGEPLEIDYEAYSDFSDQQFGPGEAEVGP